MLWLQYEQTNCSHYGLTRSTLKCLIQKREKNKCLQNIKTASSCSIVDIENKNYQGLNTNYAQKEFYTNIRIQIKMDVKYHPAIIFLVNKYWIQKAAEVEAAKAVDAFWVYAK